MAQSIARRGRLLGLGVILVAALVLAAGCNERSSTKTKSPSTWAQRLAEGDPNAYGELRDKGAEALPLLQGLLAHANENVVANAAGIIGNLSKEQAAPAADALMAALARFPGQPHISQTLKELKAAAMPSILRALGGNDPELKQSAAKLLSGMGDASAPAVEPLIAILQGDDDDKTKLEAIGAIGSLKLAAEPAQPFLADIVAAGGPLAEYARRAIRRYESAQAWMAGKEADKAAGR